jgi:hypothetical protein
MTPASDSSKPYLLIFGATGRTGQDIVNGLLRVGGLVSELQACSLAPKQSHCYLT